MRATGRAEPADGRSRRTERRERRLPGAARSTPPWCVSEILAELAGQGRESPNRLRELAGARGVSGVKWFTRRRPPIWTQENRCFGRRKSAHLREGFPRRCELG